MATTGSARNGCTTRSTSSNCSAAVGFARNWFETGTPTFLIETLLRRQVDIPSLDGLRSDDALLSRFDVRDMAPEALLFQTGYLTIRDEERAFDGTPLYRLGYPNHEVRRSLNASLLAALTPPDATRRNPGLTLVERLRARDFAGIERLVRGLFASIPYEWHTRNEIARYEGYYASVFYAWLAAVGLDVTVDDSSSRGRADLAVRFAGDVFCSSSSARGPRGARRPVTLDLEGTRDGQLIPPHHTLTLRGSLRCCLGRWRRWRPPVAYHRRKPVLYIHDGPAAASRGHRSRMRTRGAVRLR